MASKDDSVAIFKELTNSFHANCESSLKLENELFTKAELLCRGVSAFGQVLNRTVTTNPIQNQIPCLFLEVFADTTCSIYLSASAINSPAKAALRRGFEIGLASVFLWDMPHRFIGWKKLDSDLSFSEMIEHLNSDQYCAYVSELNNSKTEVLLDAGKCKELYRRLSNTIHGKITTFETMKAGCFKNEPAKWKLHLSDTILAIELLFTLWSKRFPKEIDVLKNEMPQLTRVL